jgi:hypothetical protein
LNRILIAVIALFLAVTSIPVSHAAVGQIDGRGAFLSTRADNVKALVKEISSNPAVAARYARHFGATPAYLTQYFGNKLTLITLKKPRVVTSYFVTSGGSPGE